MKGADSLAIALVLLALAGLGAVASLVATRDPEDPRAVAAVIGSASLAAGALASLLLLRASASGFRARASRLRALRRGLGVGAIVGIVGTLRVIDGLTPLTAFFVVLPFAVAELVVSRE